MEVYYPLYYNDFECLADKCPNSCCVGWEIGLDRDITEKYHSLYEPYRSEICRHIYDGMIRMTDDGRCPFLEKSGLCKIISSLGESYISEICREHPRFYNKIIDRVECGIGASCPEACRLILSRDDYNRFTLCSVKGEKSGEETDFDTLGHREEIYSILSDDRWRYAECISQIKERYGVPNITSRGINLLLSDLEYLNEEHRGMLCVGRSVAVESVVYCRRFLAYLIFRHLSVATSYDNLRARLGFCLLLCEILENFCQRGITFDEIVSFARIISEEIEYSEDNTDSIVFEFECLIN